jgi:hypothetical protein
MGTDQAQTGLRGSLLLAVKGAQLQDPKLVSVQRGRRLIRHKADSFIFNGNKPLKMKESGNRIV